MSSIFGRPQPTAPAGLTRRRPAWVWIITIFYGVSIGYGLLSSALVLSGDVRLTPAQQAYVAALGPADYITSIGLSLLTLTATVLLFAMKKAAVPLFAASLFVNLAYSVVHAVTTNWAQTLGGSGLVGAFLGWGILAAITSYSRHLGRAGVLR